MTTKELWSFRDQAVARVDLTGFELQSKHGLLTNDALLLAVARRLKVVSLASADRSFDEIPGLTLYRPEDLAA